MHKVTDIQRCQEIARACTIAFRHEQGTFTIMLDETETQAVMQAVIHMAITSKHLYENEAQSAWIYVYHKHDKPDILAQAQMGWYLLTHISPQKMEAMQQAMQPWLSAPERFRKEKDYLYIYLFAIKPEYQHHGQMRAIINEFQKQAEQEQIPIILDTDAIEKQQKYEACGFTTIAKAQLSFGIQQYAMIWRPS